MDKSIQLHLLCMKNEPVRIGPEEKLDPRIITLLNNNTIISRDIEMKILRKMPQEEMTAIPGAAGVRYHTLPIVQRYAVVVCKYT